MYAAWLSLDPEDNDPLCFLSSLLAALQIHDPSIGGNVQMLLSSPLGIDSARRASDSCSAARGARVNPPRWISFTGTPEQLGNNPEVRRVYLGESFTLV